MAVGVWGTGSSRSSSPPQTIISLSVQTVMGPNRGLGASIVLVAIQLSVVGLYRPPVLNRLRSVTESPPQTIISLPLQTAAGKLRAVGVSVVLVTIQLSVVGLYRPPVLTGPKRSNPPQTIISLPVQTAV